MKKRCSAFSIAISTAATVTMERNGNMMRVSRTVSSSLPGTARSRPRRARPAVWRTRCPRRTIEPGDDQQKIDDVRAEAAARSGAALCERAGERRHQRRAHRAFGEQIAEHIGKAEGDAEGVHRIAGAEEVGENLIANEPEHPAGHRRHADDAGRSDELVMRLVEADVGRVLRFKTRLRLQLAPDQLVHHLAVDRLAGQLGHDRLHDSAHVLRRRCSRRGDGVVDGRLEIGRIDGGGR